MGRIIRALRNQKPHRCVRIRRAIATTIPNVRETTTATIKRIYHERGRGAPLCDISYQILNTETNKYETKTSTIVALEGTHVGMQISIGTKVPVLIGNCLQLKHIPEGVILSLVERNPYDGGKFAKSPGTNVSVVLQNRKTNTTTVKLPSGQKLDLKGECRAFIGLIAGGGNVDKPLLKAGNAYYKYKARGIQWPNVRGVAMNPVDHPHGGGNHQHVGHPTTVSRGRSLNGRVGLVAARRTGVKKGVTK
ncbi:60S ribosomal protein L8 [Cucumispora dikerogammari]|nr:60S ribosomal protein L8 [Cucumispora dikerogammari]